MIIDFQAHVFPETYIDEMKRLDGAVVLEPPDPHSGMIYFYDKKLKSRINTATFQGQNIERRIELMDRLGIDVHVLTIPAPGADRYEGEDAIRMARVANDAIAAIARKHPKRFIGFFTLPTASIQASLDELVEIIQAEARVGEAASLDPSRLPTDVVLREEILSVSALGGAANLTSVDACTTRLRLTLADRSRIDEAALKGLGTGAAEFFNGLGVKTQLSYRGQRLLRGFDAELGTRIAEEMSAKGVEVCLGCEPAAMRKVKDGSLEIEFTDGRLQKADLVMVATGRRPNSAGLGLEQAGVKIAKDGAIVVDRFSRTSVASIHAIGDVTDRLNLTPVATAEAMWLARSLFRDEPTPVDHDNVPTAVFTDPNLATVGLSEERARERHGEVDIYKASFRALKLTLTDKKERTFLKLIVERKSQRVVGAHVIGADAGEIIQGVAIAVKLGATKAQFDATIGIHPTAAEEFVTMREKAS
jgi:hypothetical protein